MTPAQISREAAEQVCRYQYESGYIPSNAELNALAALILSAAAKMVQQTGAEAALAPFATFHERYQAKPMQNMADEFYGIHTGTPHEASIRHTDMKRAAAALTALRALTEHKGEA